MEKLKARRAEIGRLLFECQYQNNASPLEGILLKEEWLHCYNPLASEFQSRLREMVYVMGVDPAITESPTVDYTAMVVLDVDVHTKDCYVMEIWRDRMDFPSQVKVPKERYEYMKKRNMGPTRIAVESVAYQKALAKTALLSGLPVKEVKSSTSKLHRMYGLVPSIENGRVKFPDPAVQRAGWLDDFKLEYLAYPNGEHDDQLDALAFALEVADVSSLSPAFAFGPPIRHVW